MLVLSRRSGERFQIRLGSGVGQDVTAAELFATGPIEIVVTQIHGSCVRLGIRADRRFLILREELYGVGEDRVRG